jgi:hypothetical protein
MRGLSFAAMTRKNKILIGLGVFVVVLVAARLALPSRQGLREPQLAALEAYHGHVGDIDIHLWRGAYSIDDIVIVKNGASRPCRSSARTRRSSVEWHSLLRGHRGREAAFDSPELNLVQAENEQDSQLGQGEDWHARLEELFPFRFNTVQVSNGTVRFLAPGIQTRDAITARHVNGSVTNLTNVIETGKETFADFRINGRSARRRPAVVAGSVDAFAKQPTFDVNMEVKKVQLPQVNPWCASTSRPTPRPASSSCTWNWPRPTAGSRLCESPSCRTSTSTVPERPKRIRIKRCGRVSWISRRTCSRTRTLSQVAARIPFTGTLEDPETSLFATIASVLRNAFVSAFARSLEGSITLRDVKKNLEGIDPNKEPGRRRRKRRRKRKRTSQSPVPPARVRGFPRSAAACSRRTDCRTRAPACRRH